MQVSSTYIASFVPEIPTAVSVTILLYFDQDTYTYLLLYAPVLIKIPTHTYCCMRRFLRRFLRGCVAVCAVVSPSHRRIASAPHRVATVAWRLHWNYNCQWCHRLVARGLKKCSHSSGL